MVQKGEIRMKKTGMLLLSLLLFAGCANTAADKEGQTVQPGCSEDSFGCAAETKPSAADFTEITFDEAIGLFENGGSGLLYFGFPDCPWCQEVVPILAKQAKEAGVEVLYIRTRDDDKERIYTDAQKEAITPYLSAYMSDNEQGELTLYVPLIVSVSEGKAVKGHVGTVDGHDAHAGEMSEEQKAQAQEEILEVVESVSGASNSKAE